MRIGSTRAWAAVLAGAAVMAFSASARAQITITYSDFSDLSGIQLNGDAAGAVAGGNNVLRLTKAQSGQSGSAFLKSSITLLSNASFSTAFQFQITNSGGIGDEDGPGADGLAFVVQTNSSTVGGGGGGIGYAGIPNSLGVEYDTYNNGLPGDPNGNHVGVDLSGSVDSVATALVPTRMNDGNVWYSWVDYDGTTQILEVRLSQSSTRPVSPFLSYTVDLPTKLGSSNAYVGFTSGTGSGWGDHDILAWQFTNTFKPIGTAVPEPGSAAVLVGSLAGALALLRRRRA